MDLGSCISVNYAGLWKRLAMLAKRSLLGAGNAKVVKAEMKVLDGRQQETLSRLCIKLREGDAVMFLKELMLLRGEHQED
jgi:hypothetical protein